MSSSKKSNNTTIIVVVVVVLLLAIGITIVVNWDKITQKKTSTDEAEDLGFTGRTRHLPLVNDPVGTEYVTIREVRYAWDGLPRIAGVPRAGSNPPPGNMPAGTVVRKMRPAVEYGGYDNSGHQEIWMVTNKGWVLIDDVVKR